MARMVIRHPLPQFPVPQALTLAGEFSIPNQGEIVFFGNSLGPFTSQDPRRAITLLKDELRQQHRILNPFHTDHGTVIEAPPAHDPAIEFYLSIQVQNPSAAGIEGPA